jgi:TonB family protein
MKNITRPLLTTVFVLTTGFAFSQSGAMCASNTTIKKPAATQQAATPSFFSGLCEIEPQFEGGEAGWTQFLQTNTAYPQGALDAGISGEVVVSFVVNSDGTVKNIQLVSGNELLAQEAKRLIELSSGRWQPANQNGFRIPFRLQQKMRFLLQ